MKKIYETPQIIVTAFEGENSMLTKSSQNPYSISKNANNTVDFGQLK